MYDLERMKKALEGPTMCLPSGVSHELRRAWICNARNYPTYTEFVNAMDEQHPGYRTQMEEAVKRMIKVNDSDINPFYRCDSNVQEL